MAGKFRGAGSWALNGNNASGGNTTPSAVAPTGGVSRQSDVALNGGAAGAQSTSGGSTETVKPIPANQDFQGK